MRSLDMKYSVLMPVYRKENPFYFYRAALSMMKQSVSPDEFVLVCDGPLTEELDAVIRKLEETWVRTGENRASAGKSRHRTGTGSRGGKLPK